VKVELYEMLAKRAISRRNLLKGAASASALAAVGPGIAGFATPAFAEGNLRAEILKVPGVGAGSPTDADWQKVGEMCLGATKANVKEGEFKGVELSFMGLNNQNLHNVLFRGLLYAWEQYTGAKINWIDLAQADYNARLQQSIATGTVDFDIAEMGAPFEGDVCGKGLASVMPDWVKEQIDMADYVGYLQAPVGTWDGKTYRISVDGDCHNFNYRTDVFGSADLAKAWKDEGHQGDWGVPKTWQQVQDVTKFLKGKQLDGQDLLLPRLACDGLCQAPRRQGLAVRSGHDEAAHQQPGLGPHHPGRDRRAAVRTGRPAQRRPRHHRVPAVPGRHRLDGLLVG
jgi:multiple sugar transport system substrate-binding protein